MRGKASLLLMFVALPGLLGSPAAFGASSVAVKDGNIVLLQDGRERQLTKSGKDADPALSPDGKWVAFTRVGNPASTGSQGDCKSGAQADELRRIRVDGTGEELLVRGREGRNDPKQSICDFSSKQFTSDGRYIYFLSPAWATSAALHRYDTSTKALTFVIDANDCKKAESRDNIVVNQHRYFVVAGSYDWYWLFDGAGKKEKGPVGEFDSTQAARDAINASALCEP
jgi:dipeptidyl aminopeptidase/acylaminoacyl peptidase